MRFPPPLLFLLVTAPTSASSTPQNKICATSNDCGLNGDCVSSSCVCDPAWTGSTCTKLNLVPVTPDFAEAGVYKHGSQTSWGANVLREDGDGLFHMFVAEMQNNCTLSSWIPNGMITHAVSDSLLGPFEYVETLFSTFHHNPRLVVDPATNKFLLFMIGGSLNGTDDCR